MGKLGQTWQSIKEYWKASVFVPFILAVIGFITHCSVAGKEVAVVEMITVVLWVIVPSLVGFIIVFFWHYFRDPYVRVEANVVQVNTYDYYARVQGDNNNKSDKEIMINITLTPSKIVRIDNIALKIRNVYFEARELSVMQSAYVPFSPRKVKDRQTFMVSFNVPKALAVNTKKGRVFAITNNIKRFSKPFPIDFGD